MNPWKRLHNEFKKLTDEEDRIVQQRVPQDFCYAYVAYRESAEVDCWVESTATEGLQAGFELLATEAGIALGAPSGTPPHKYWLHQLFVDLRANNSNHIHIYSDTPRLKVSRLSRETSETSRETTNETFCEIIQMRKRRRRNSQR